MYNIRPPGALGLEEKMQALFLPATLLLLHLLINGVFRICNNGGLVREQIGYAHTIKPYIE